MEQESKGKEVNSMKTYTKPELVLCGDASQAIQGIGKQTMANDAQVPHEPPATTPAYEADE